MARKLPLFDESISPHARNMAQLGALIRNRRAESATRIDDAADMLGVSKDVLSRLENGKTIGLDNLYKILDGMGLSLLVVDKQSAQRVLHELDNPSDT
ncbi:MAG TPA: helix-turn-helix domain-containing protein [Burkholderiaceae bacterium]|nr:helix-turn-helix domain-containing protein [Burkholderiaceae bacterium]